MKTENAYDLTQAERIDAFGTADVDALIEQCRNLNIPYVIRPNRVGIVIWRKDLPQHLEERLRDQERQGVRYTEGWRAA